MFLVAPNGSRDEILPSQHLASAQVYDLPDLSSHDAIDEHLARHESTTAAKLIAAGYTDHAAEIVHRYGDDVFVCVHIGAPAIIASQYGSRGYEESLLAIYDCPEGVKYLVRRRYEIRLEWAKAFAKVGVHGLAVSEGYSGADTISPRTYEEFIYPVDCWYFDQVSQLGVIPLVFFCGDIRPLVPLIRESGVRGLLIEDSRKTFALNVIEIAEGLEGKVCLFGNVDTTDLLYHGRPKEIEAAVCAQLRAARVGPFVVANGSPIVPGTPPENVEALIRAARTYGHYPVLAENVLRSAAGQSARSVVKS